MRCHQYIGLSKRAERFLKKNAQRQEKEKCEHCGSVIRGDGYKTDVARYEEGMEEMFPLYRYFLKDGGTVSEFLQEQPWSSGPMSFIALRNEQTGKIIGGWMPEEIDEML